MFVCLVSHVLGGLGPAQANHLSCHFAINRFILVCVVVHQKPNQPNKSTKQTNNTNINQIKSTKQIQTNNTNNNTNKQPNKQTNNTNNTTNKYNQITKSTKQTTQTTQQTNTTRMSHPTDSSTKITLKFRKGAGAANTFTHVTSSTIPADLLKAVAEGSQTGRSSPFPATSKASKSTTRKVAKTEKVVAPDSEENSFSYYELHSDEEDEDSIKSRDISLGSF